MTNIEGLLAAYDEQLRGVPADLPHGVTAERDGPVTRLVGRRRGLVTAPPRLGVRGDALDRLIVRQRDRFAARGEAVEWKTHGHDRPEELVDRLRAAGFVPEERETVMVGRTDVIASGAPPDEVALLRVSEPDDMRRIAAMESRVWGGDWSWLGDDLIALVASDPDGVAVMVAEADGEVVSAAWLVFRRGTEFAGLWGGSTLPEWRGKGIYRSLVAARARIAAARGVRYLQVDASGDSAPILRRLGFEGVTTTTPYVWSPP
ncbi:GNAT family N-acetyltransferase [Nocardiopsis sp. CT-R113]|uniref:GNAT family N-acetyltransferase n=1 Tax=Nocardiopsis codii TaxID=3065942 RepID=A0ABU7KA84_9ACTN|nr:GNAT family N-acetyltransferase [Nocardiopsis sp. CT-R113]MEE2039154.1 GNAT family N-acetyltransferase [Nocardiopsis sp. CT-R113]